MPVTRGWDDEDGVDEDERDALAYAMRTKANTDAFIKLAIRIGVSQFFIGAFFFFTGFSQGLAFFLAAIGVLFAVVANAIAMPVQKCQDKVMARFISAGLEAPESDDKDVSQADAEVAQQRYRELFNRMFGSLQNAAIAGEVIGSVIALVAGAFLSTVISPVVACWLTLVLIPVATFAVGAPIVKAAMKAYDREDPELYINLHTEITAVQNYLANL